MRYEFRPQATCNMCGSGASKLLGMRLSASQGFRPRKAEGIAVPVKKCSDCGLVYADPLPIPEKISDHYGLPAEDYWHREALTWTPDYFSRQIEAAKQLISFVPGMKALDVGVGLGKAFKSLAIAGFDVWGCEPSDPFKNKAIELMGLEPRRVQLAPIEQADYPPQSFDFITFGAVLEHLYDPHAALSRAMGWLKPGGVIQAEVPSSDWLIPKLMNLYFRLMGTNYVTHISPMHAPFHLYEFSLKSFRKFDVARHWYDVGTVPHIPSLVRPLFREWMRRTDTGMQLTVYLRQAAS